MDNFEVIITTAIIGFLISYLIARTTKLIPRAMEAEWEAEIANCKGEPEPTPLPATYVITGAIHCPACEAPLPWISQTPIIGKLASQKCKQCGAQTTLRATAIGFSTALLSGLIAWRFGFGWQMVAALTLTWALITLTIIDAETMLLPDSITLPLLWAGLIVNLNGLFSPIDSAVMGAIGGYMSLWLVYWAFKLCTGKEGMGYGDFKLLAALGAWFGTASLPTIIIWSSCVGLAAGIFFSLKKKSEASEPFPFGPYLAGAGISYLFVGEQIKSWLFAALI